MEDVEEDVGEEDLEVINLKYEEFDINVEEDLKFVVIVVVEEKEDEEEDE